MATQKRRKTSIKTKPSGARRATKQPASAKATKPNRSAYSRTKKIVKVEKKIPQPVDLKNTSNEIVSLDATTVAQWSLVAIGELYLTTIVFALIVLGILYWATAMTQIVQTVQLFGI